ncbi:MAG: VWA domain-containing protein [Myxococcales bacterium]|nr:VWA domain-containing protein [Myxococcales bacterium]
MRRFWAAMIPGLLLAAAAPGATGPIGDLRVEIQSPAPGQVLSSAETSVQVVGGASVFGGVRYLDLFLVLDTSRSLKRTDPRDYRRAGAIGLVRSLPPRSDIQIGVVDFDRTADLLSPLTSDRDAVVGVLERLDRSGRTDLAAGIRAALDGFAMRGRQDASRVMLLFTDGKSDDDETRRAMAEARREGVAIHTLMLGTDPRGMALLGEVADGTGGSFLRVTDPARLPEAFLNLRTTGVEQVTLRVGDSAPIPAELSGGTFSGRVPVQPGENRLVATATSLDGETREHAVIIHVSGPLSVVIDAPVDGTLMTERASEITVEGQAGFFSESPSGTGALLPDGVTGVVLTVNDSPLFATTLEDGRFRGRVLLQDGENRIVATATGADGTTATAAATVSMRVPGCGELRVEAESGGKPALSLSERGVEIVVDASNSMWGRMQGRPKISVAQEILQDSLDWLPNDLRVALRVYGHQHKRELRNCEDSQLLVPFASGSRDRIRSAIGEFRPRGQTPLAYSLQQVAGDFGGFRGERAVVLVTDGIESCGGDPVAAARALQHGGRTPVHVIGFGLASGGDEDSASLRAIAQASGGRYLTARSAEELRDALTVTVGTSFRLVRGDVTVAAGALGGREPIRAPAGEYQIRIDSAPPLQLPVAIASEEHITLQLKRERGKLFHRLRRRPAAYVACHEPPGTPEAALPAAPTDGWESP